MIFLQEALRLHSRCTLIFILYKNVEECYLTDSIEEYFCDSGDYYFFLEVGERKVLKMNVFVCCGIL